MQGNAEYCLQKFQKLKQICALTTGIYVCITIMYVTKILVLTILTLKSNI